MAISEILNPRKTISGYDSDAVSTTQILYKVQREDYEAESLIASIDTIVLPAALGDVSADFKEGDRVYYSDLDTVYTIESVSYDGGSGKTLIVVVENEITTGSAGYINNLTAKSGYYLKVDISPLNLTLYYIANYQGTFDFDIGKALEYAMPADSIEYSITFKGVYSGGADNTISTSPDIFAVKSRRQLLTENGANLYEYIAKTTNTAKFMTVFEEPRIWYGWYFWPTLINMDHSSGDLLLDLLDINKSVLSSGAPGSGLTPPEVRRFQLSCIWTDPIKYIGIQMVISSTTTPLSEYKYLKIYPECKQPIMLEWLNSNGARDQWLFEKEQTVSMQAAEGYKYNQAITSDIETLTKTKGRNAGTDTQFITLKAAQLSINEIEGLHDIKRSNDVRLWLNKFGTEYISVIVSQSYSTEYTTGKNNYEFTVIVEMPDNFDFFKAKSY